MRAAEPDLPVLRQLMGEKNYEIYLAYATPKARTSNPRFSLPMADAPTWWRRLWNVVAVPDIKFQPYNMYRHNGRTYCMFQFDKYRTLDKIQLWIDDSMGHLASLEFGLLCIYSARDKVLASYVVGGCSTKYWTD